MEDKEKIVKLFIDNVKGNIADTSSSNQNHDGKTGHWLEKKMGITHNADNKPDLFGYEMKNETTSGKISFGDWSADEYIFLHGRGKNKINSINEKYQLTRKQFFEIFGKPNIEKDNNVAIGTLPSIEQGYLRVKRDADVAQEIYIMLAKRLEEAKVAEVMVSNEVQVVDTATLPEAPVKPRKALTLALALLLGLMAGSGYVLAYEMFNRKLRTADDIQSYLGLTVLGTVPDIDSMNKMNTESRKKLSPMQKLRRLLKK